MEPPIVLFTKTFIGDIGQFAHLLNSIRKHNRDSIPYFVSIPEEDRQTFISSFGTEDVFWIDDDEVCGRRVPRSWVQQQIVKLHVGASGMAGAYVALDSDYFFIQDFFVSDFIGPRGVPFTIIGLGKRLAHEQNIWWPQELRPDSTSLDSTSSLLSQAALVTADLIERQFVEKLSKQSLSGKLPQALFGRPGQTYQFQPGPILCGRAIIGLRDFLDSLSMRLADLIKISPWEYQWYGEWLVHSQIVPIYPRDTFIYNFSSNSEVEAAVVRPDFMDLLRNKYLGVSLAARHIKYNSFEEVLAHRSSGSAPLAL
jgi:hypothetical protein